MPDDGVSNSELDRVIAQFQKTTDALTDLFERDDARINALTIKVALMEVALKDIKEDQKGAAKLSAQTTSRKWGIIGTIIVAILGGLFTALQSLIGF